MGCRCFRCCTLSILSPLYPPHRCRGDWETFLLEYDPGKLTGSVSPYFTPANYPAACLAAGMQPIMSVGFKGEADSSDGEGGRSGGGGGGVGLGQALQRMPRLVNYNNWAPLLLAADWRMQNLELHLEYIPLDDLTSK